MASPRYETALIVGAGAGLSASLARLFSREGIRVALAARNIEKLALLCEQTGAQAFACDAADTAQAASLFEAVEQRIGAPTSSFSTPAAGRAAPSSNSSPRRSNAR